MQLFNSDKHCEKYSLYYYFSLFCTVLSIALCMNIIKPTTSFDTPEEANESSILEHLPMLRLKNPQKVTMGHLNINSIPNKFDGIMDLVATNLDISLISEMKIDSSFPEAQFLYDGYATPHRKDRILGGGAGGGLLMYVNESIPSRTLNIHNIPNDMEILCVEINLKKQKWVLIGIYRPPNMNLTYFYDNLSRVVDCYSKHYDRIVIMGDFNSEPTDVQTQTFLIVITYIT